MAFTIHLHIGPSASAKSSRPATGWWRDRWSSRREYEAHLQRTFSALAGRRPSLEPSASSSAIELDPGDVDLTLEGSGTAFRTVGA